MLITLQTKHNTSNLEREREREREGAGVATVTSQGTEGILVEGQHPLSLVFHGLEKPLKLNFVASNSICEALSHGDAPLDGIVGHVEITHKVSECSVSVIMLPCTDGLFQPGLEVQLQQFKQQPAGIGDEVGQPRVAFETQLGVLGLDCLWLGDSVDRLSRLSPVAPVQPTTLPDLQRFQDVDRPVADAALAVLRRHTAYLRPETVVLSRQASGAADVDQR